MNRLYNIFKTPSGPSTGKALLNHTILSPSKTGETVPLTAEHMDQHAAHHGLHYSGENDLVEEQVNQHAAHQAIHHSGATRQHGGASGPTCCTLRPPS
jgi:hypothetical protein